MAVRMVASRLLYGKMAPIVSSEIFLALAVVAGIVSLLVVVEMARRAFSSASRVAWITATLVLLAVGGVVLVLWGPWPSAKTLFAGSTLGVLRLLQLIAQKAEMLADLLVIQLGILVVLFGRRFHAGWRSHVQQIVIGLSTAAMAQLGVRIIWQVIALHTTIHQPSGLCARHGSRRKVLQCRQRRIPSRAGVVDHVPMDRRAGFERRRCSRGNAARRGRRRRTRQSRRTADAK